MSSTLKFPSPVGGVPFGLDFGPSVLFASLYAIVAVGSLYRLLRSSSRTFATLGTTCNTIERVVIYTLRATQAHAPWEASSEGLTTYWQLSFSIGYLTILTDLCNVMQSLFVKTTLEQSEDLSMSSLSGEDSKTTAEPLITDDQDSSTRRALYRKLFATEKLLILIPTALGCVAGSIYASGETNSTTANVTQILRYAAGACAFALILSVQISALWGYYTIPTLRKSSVLIAFSIATILNIKSPASQSFIIIIIKR